MDQNILEVKEIGKSFEGTEVLRDITFQIEKGEFVAVMGRSGCGKSTLLYSISGMDDPTGGEVLFEGKRLAGLPEKELEKLRLLAAGKYRIDSRMMLDVIVKRDREIIFHDTLHILLHLKHFYFWYLYCS